jgi:hypothetical protein
MSLDFLQSELSRTGWRDVERRSYMDCEFDLVGSRWFTVTRWTVVVKEIPVLDEASGARWAAQFQRMSRESQGPILGSCLLMCLLADEVAPGVLETLPWGSPGRAFRWMGGGGKLLVVDRKSKQVHGTVPVLPYDVHRFSKSLKQILASTIEV